MKQEFFFFNDKQSFQKKVNSPYLKVKLKSLSGFFYNYAKATHDIIHLNLLMH